MTVEYYAGAEALTFSDECARIHRAAFSASGARGWSAHELDSLLQRDSTFLLKTQQGFLLADLIGDEAEILTIAVAPNYQGQKIGRALMSKLDETCRYRNVNKCILEVAKDNSAAKNLYFAFNYHEIAIREGYFKRDNGEIDALIMIKTFDDL